MFVVDVNTCFGESPGERTDLSLSTLVQALDSHQIGLAFTHSLRGVKYADDEGNTETLQATHSHTGLLPVATLDLRRYLDWEREVERCLDQGVRLFRLFPHVQGWSVSDSSFAALVTKLAGSQSVIMLSVNGANWPLGAATATALGQATAEHGVRAILTDVNYNNMAEVMSSMRRFSNLYMETSWLSTPGSFEVLAQEVGADRVLHGSGAPRYPVPRALNHVFEAHISEREKALVLGGNAIRLFDLAAEQMAGRPQLTSTNLFRFSEPIIDVHTHLGLWQFPIPGERATDLLALMRQGGIERAIVSSAESIMYDLAVGNRFVAEEIAGHPELLGYVVVNPNYLDLSCQEMDRYYQQPNFVGAKVHCDHSASPTASDKTRRLLEEVARRGKPIKVHVFGEGALQTLKEMALAHPEWAIIKAHGGGREMAQEVVDAPNIYFDFASSHASSHAICEALQVLGADRLLFGSDATLLSVGGALGAYYDANLTPEQRKKVLFGNAKRLFKL